VAFSTLARMSPTRFRRPSYLQQILPPYLQRALWFLKGWIVLRYHGVEFEGRPNIRGKLPQIENAGRMHFGPKFSILGRTLPAALVTTPGAEITFGYRVHLNHGVVVYAAERVTIGDYCLIGDMAVIYDTSFHQLQPDRPVHTAPVTIGNNVWIARGAMILPGVTIGDYAVIGANAVVSKDVPARTVVAGNPAKPVGKELVIPDDSWWRM
jgi:acetyltransferase-like isoleucine patch superfamily enzyme